MLLSVSHISKSYPGLPVLHDVSFTAGEGEIVCLLGPSGCGKTTVLRIVAGLEAPDTGAVCVAGQDLAGVPAHRRNFGLMFQDFALFPHKDVAANVAFGLRMQGTHSEQVLTRVREMLALVGLAGYERRNVVELSGGEQQRVALARSLAPHPRLLMLDEPLGALDRALREQLMNELRVILKGVGVTALYVTHDQEEAFAIADRILIMRARLEAGEGGRVEQEGPPEEVYRRPATAYVARFLGFRNLLDGIVTYAGGETDSAEQQAAPFSADTSIGRLFASDATGQFAVGSAVTVLVRPEAASLRPPDASGANVLAGQLVSASFRGSYYLVRTRHSGDVELTCEISATNSETPPAGAAVGLWLDPSAIILLPRMESSLR